MRKGEVTLCLGMEQTGRAQELRVRGGPASRALEERLPGGRWGGAGARL